MGKSRPILFNTEMIQAILDGQKTQTRRVIKANQRTSWLLDGRFSDNYIKEPDNYLIRECPYGKIGDLLWVRETFWEVDGYYFYRADGRDDFERWKPSIHMPKIASRITLEIADIRVERVQDIYAKKDILAEGITDRMAQEATKTERDWPDAHAAAFANLWDSINAKRGYSWDSNPWCWVVDFKRIDP